MMRRLFIAWALALLSALPMRAQLADTTLREVLDSTVFRSARRSSLLDISPAQPVLVNMELLQMVPSITGSPDPIRFVRLLPGVQTGMELDAGLHILGTDNSHSLVSVAGVPVYGASHVLGLFSTFIPSHYQGMSFSPYVSRANRLGGSVDMQLPDKVPQRLRGQLSAGLFESEGTLDIPTGSRSAAFVSLRRSYINLLYGSFLRMGVYDFRYGFTDGNFTWFWEPGSHDRIWVDFMMGGDDILFDSSRGGYHVEFNWANMMGALHHRHSWDWGQLEHSVYATRLNMELTLDHDIYNIRLPSLMGTVGYKAALSAGRWRGDFRLDFHHSNPQQVDVRNKDLAREGIDETQDALEATAEIQYLWPILEDLSLEASLKGIWYQARDGASYPALLPNLRLVWDAHWAGKVELVAGLSRQNLFQTGASSIGLPTEFWYLSGKDIAPQSSRHASLSWGRSLLGDRYAVSVSAFYRRLFNQLDFRGTLVDYLDPGFYTPKYLQVGSGRNYGLCLTFHKQSGDFTGWVNYTLARSLRTFDGITFPSNHERIHELNAVASYKLGRWDFGGVLVLASGTPYTVAESFYMTGGTLITEFSPRNASRMRPYLRVDLSTSYYFHRKPDGRGNGLRFSLYNAVGYKNDVYLALTLSPDARSFSYVPSSLYIRFLPSLTYFHSF